MLVYVLCILPELCSTQDSTQTKHTATTISPSSAETKPESRHGSPEKETTTSPKVFKRAY